MKRVLRWVLFFPLLVIVMVAEEALAIGEETGEWLGE
jgi:hypothetical protein